MILSAQSIMSRRGLIEPFSGAMKFKGFTYGLSACGYDFRIAENISLFPGEFQLASSFERFKLPDDLLMMVVDKSTWARKGLAVQNTVAEPGWEGYLTLELTNHHPEDVIYISSGTPIAQALFVQLDEPTLLPYKGKYQDAPKGITKAILEG